MSTNFPSANLHSPYAIKLLEATDQDPMNFITLEICVNSAVILKNVNFFYRTRIYTIVSLISRNSISTQRTNVDEHNGLKPSWWFKMKFNVEESKMHENSCMLVFQVSCRKTLGDKDIGYLYLPVKELFDGVCWQKFPRDVAYTISTKSGKPKGVLYLTYKFGESLCVPNIMNFPVPSAPPCYLLEGGFPATTTSSATSAAPYIEGKTGFKLIVGSLLTVLPVYLFYRFVCGFCVIP